MVDRRKAGKKARNKGQGFERKVAKLFAAAYDLDIRRTPLSGGWAKGSPDVAGDLVCVTPDVEFPYCVECKKAEGWKLENLFTDQHAWFDNWWTQVLNECPDGKTPILVFSRAYAPIFIACHTRDGVYYTGLAVLFVKIFDEDIVITTIEEYLEYAI